MTVNQEKELFNTLAGLVTGVNEIKSDVKDIKVTLTEHSHILRKHSDSLNLLVSKVDTIADTVMTNDKRLTAVEKEVSDLRGGAH